MILVPYVWDTRHPDWITFGLFLMDMCSARWSLDEGETTAEVEAMLLENGFPVVRLETKGEIVFAEIDASRLKLEHFYIWNELSPSDPENSEKDCWRLFKLPKVLWNCNVFQESFWKPFPDLRILSENLLV